MDKNALFSKLLDSSYTPRRIFIDGHQISYVVKGAGDPLLLIHGINIGLGQWYKNIGELAKKFTVYAIDLPGSGDSSKVDFSKIDLEKDFVAVVANFIRQLGLKDLIIVGHSFGGWIALKLALLGTVGIKKIILVSSMGLTSYLPPRYFLVVSGFFTKLMVATVMRPTRENMKDFLLSVVHGSKVIDEDFVDYFYSTVNKDSITHPFSLIHQFVKPFRIQDRFVFFEEISSITTPILGIAGSRDPLIPFNKVKQRYTMFPNADLRIIDDTGHTPFLEQPKIFNNLVINFCLST